MSFLKHYGNFIENTEAHKTYHMWCALVAISSLVSRRVWVPQGHFTIYPNIYVVLVGPPGNRKTTAMSTCKKLLRQFPEDIPLSAEAITKEALVREMAGTQRAFEVKRSDGTVEMFQYAPMTVCVTELSQFLGTGADRMVDFLTTVYDEDIYRNKTKNKAADGQNEDLIHGPYLTVLACTTPSWITNYLKSDIISGGFSRRAIFVYENERGERIPFPEISEYAKAEWDLCVVHARKLAKVKGVFTWASDARDWYSDWYKTLKIPENSPVTGYFESKHAQLLKVSMLVALSEGFELILTKEIMQAGLAMLETIEKNLHRVFEGMGRNPLNNAAAYVMDFIERAGGFVADKQLQKATYHQVDRMEYSNVMQHLKETDRVKDVMLDWDNNGTQRKYWVTPQGLDFIAKRAKPVVPTPAASVPTSA